MNKLINFLNKILFMIRGDNQKQKDMKKILIVSNTALGDTILSTPVIKTLKKNFSDIHITLMVNKNVYPLFKDYEYVNEVIFYQNKFFELIKHAYFIKKMKIDTIFLVHSNGPQDLFIALLSGVKTINKAINLNSDLINNNHNYSVQMNTLTKKVISNPIRYNTYQHIVEHRLNILSNYHITNIDKTLSLPSKYYDSFCNQYHYPQISQKTIIALQLGASETYRRWPVHYFAELTNLILKDNNDIIIVLLGSTQEQDLTEEFFKFSLYPNKILNFCGKTSIQELPCLVKKCALLITGDTGTLHLAISLKVKTLSLFSASDSNIFGPYQDQTLHEIIQKDGSKYNLLQKKDRDQSAMKLITINEVYKKVILQIQKVHLCVE